MNKDEIINHINSIKNMLMQSAKNKLREYFQENMSLTHNTHSPLNTNKKYVIEDSSVSNDDSNSGKHDFLEFYYD
jgi:hypothetical protein